MKRFGQYLRVTTSITLGWIATSNVAIAQILPDATLPNNSVVNVEGEVNRITGGTTAGNNLFHSFREFSVLTGGIAYFNNAPEIQNIFSRVTGGSVSNIDGLIRANGTANLFLLNPNGIIFGRNASLDIGGSFLGSTANSLRFADGSEFGVAPTQTTPLLTVSVPLGLQFGQTPGRIRVEGSGQNVGTNGAIDSFGDEFRLLQVSSGNTLALVGGEIELDGGILQAPGGQVELGGLAGAGTVGLNGDRTLSFPSSGVARANVSLTNGSGVNVLGDDRGSIAINGRNIDILGGSLLITGIISDLGSPDAKGGDITLSATEVITIESSYIANNVNPDATGNGGDIIINSGALFLRDNAAIDSATFGKGNAGNILVEVDGVVSLENSQILSNVAGEEGEGGNINRANSGNISITAGSVSLTDAKLESSTSGKGRAGDIDIKAEETVAIASSNIRSSADALGGQAGLIAIGANERVAIANSTIQTDSSGLATRVNSPNEVKSSEEATGIYIFSTAISVDNSSLTSTLLGEGYAGFIMMEGDTVAIARSTITSNADDRGGQAGLIGIEANERVAIANSTIQTDSSGLTTTIDNPNRVKSIKEATGIYIFSKAISITDKSFLTSTLFGPGYAGFIMMKGDTVAIADSNIVSDAISDDKNSGGMAGGVVVVADNSVFIKNSAITADSYGTTLNGGNGTAGEIGIEARSLELDKAIITASNVGGNGGDIGLMVQELVRLRQNSKIETNAGTDNVGGNGGNIQIQTRFLVGSENSDITANAYEGSGGKIQIDARGIFGLENRQQETQKSDITAISQQNPQLNGEVEINTPDVGTSGLIELPENPVDVEGLVARDLCGDETERSSFTVTGRGGLPPNPSDPLNNTAPIVEWALREAGAPGVSRDGVSSPAVRSQGWTKDAINRVTTTIPDSATLVEAQGWMVAPDGTIILTANAPTVTPHGAGLPRTGCHL